MTFREHAALPLPLRVFAHSRAAMLAHQRAIDVLLTHARWIRQELRHHEAERDQALREVVAAARRISSTTAMTELEELALLARDADAQRDMAAEWHESDGREPGAEVGLVT